MTTAEILLIAVSSLGLYVVFGAQVAKHVTSYDDLPSPVRRWLAPTPPRSSRGVGRVVAVAVALGFCVASQFNIVWLLLARFDRLALTDVVALAAELTLAVLFTVYLWERSHPK